MRKPPLPAWLEQALEQLHDSNVPIDKRLNISLTIEAVGRACSEALVQFRHEQALATEKQGRQGKRNQIRAVHVE